MPFIRRLLNILPTLFVVSVLAFGLIRLVPGDPVMLLLGERGADPAVYAEMKHNLGLDLPIFQQYFKFVAQAFTGNLGTSIISKQPVLVEFMDRFPATLELGLVGMLWATLLGIPLGIIAAMKRGSLFDFFAMGGSLIGYSMPIFWWGLVLILIFSVQMGLTPVSGRISVYYEIPHITGLYLIDSWFSEEGIYAFFSAFRHILLPSIVLGTIPLAVIARMTRSAMLEVLKEDYIRTAKAKGLTQVSIVIRHGFRNALIPVVTVIGLLFGTIITGAILTETIFSWPGIGKWIVASVTSRDYPVIQGGILLIATMVMLINMLVDISYGYINPKLKGGSN